MQDRALLCTIGVFVGYSGEPADKILGILAEAWKPDQQLLRVGALRTFRQKVQGTGKIRHTRDTIQDSTGIERIPVGARGDVRKPKLDRSEEGQVGNDYGGRVTNYHVGDMGQEQEFPGEKADKGCADEDQRQREAEKQAFLQGLEESIFPDGDVYFLTSAGRESP